MNHIDIEFEIDKISNIWNKIKEPNGLYLRAVENIEFKKWSNRMNDLINQMKYQIQLLLDLILKNLHSKFYSEDKFEVVFKKQLVIVSNSMDLVLREFLYISTLRTSYNRNH